MRRVDTSERAGSPISATVHPLHKKGRSDNNLASVDDIAMDIGLDPLTGDVNVSARSRTTPFKDKLLGELSGYCGRVERISDDDVKGLQARQNRGTGLVKKRGKAVTLQHEGSESSREENRGGHINMTLNKQCWVAALRVVLSTSTSLDTSDWDWKRFAAQLSESTIDKIAAISPPRSRYGVDLPGWRWEEKHCFTPFDDWLKENIRVKSHPASTTVDWSVRQCPAPEWIVVCGASRYSSGDGGRGTRVLGKFEV
ncbi:hypothetical protein V6N11_060526 [Hibiscus sabdariffa]|uniref:Uncharacterized protein n=1 Tax=Hibiscus sabdariffa TaxID=183260 RepID=A0ABR2QQL1_9ROSI